jgi:hypothetical protein
MPRNEGVPGSSPGVGFLGAPRNALVVRRSERRGRADHGRPACESVELGAGGELLERSRGEGARIGGAPRVDVGHGDDHVPELGCCTRGTAVELAVENEAAADSDADGDHREVAADDRFAVGGFSQRGAVRVVLDVDRQADPLAQDLAQRQVEERDVEAVADASGRELDDRRHADADRRGLLRPQRLHDRDKPAVLY